MVLRQPEGDSTESRGYIGSKSFSSSAQIVCASEAYSTNGIPNEWKYHSINWSEPHDAIYAAPFTSTCAVIEPSVSRDVLSYHILRGDGVYEVVLKVHIEQENPVMLVNAKRIAL